MRTLFRIIHIRLCYRFPRFKLWRISKAVGIKPEKWQRDFALRKRVPIDELLGPRRNGKTMAVMLRMLMINPYGPPDRELWQLELRMDKDFDARDPHRIRWYSNEYRKLALRCAKLHIPIVGFNIRRITEGRMP